LNSNKYNFELQYHGFCWDADEDTFSAEEMAMIIDAEVDNDNVPNNHLLNGYEYCHTVEDEAPYCSFNLIDANSWQYRTIICEENVGDKIDISVATWENDDDGFQDFACRYESQSLNNTDGTDDDDAYGFFNFQYTFSESDIDNYYTVPIPNFKPISLSNNSSIYYSVVWRYFNGGSNNPLDFGSINIGDSKSHINSNRDRSSELVANGRGIHCFNLYYLNKKVFYKFTTQAKSHISIGTDNSNFDPYITLYNSDASTVIGSDDNSGSGSNPVITMNNLSAGTYIIEVSAPADDGGQFELFLESTSVEPPSNDDCANPITLTQYATCNPQMFSSLGATESEPSCNNGIADDDVWFEFTATTSEAKIIVEGDDFYDPVIQVYNPAAIYCSSAPLSHCVDETSSGGSEFYSLQNLTIGDVYTLRVYDYSSSPTDNNTFNICLTDFTIPSNDERTNPINLNHNSFCNSILSNTKGASDSNALGCSTGDSDDDVWFRFNAQNSSAIIRITGLENFDAVFDVYNELNYNNGPITPCIDYAFSGEEEAVRLDDLSVGDSYLIRVYSYQMTSMSSIIEGQNFVICVSFPKNPPINDECNGAIRIPHMQNAEPISFNSFGATQSIEACNNNGDADDDMWFRFEANSPNATIQAVGIGMYDPVIELYFASTNIFCSTNPIECINNNGSGGTEELHIAGLTIGEEYAYRIYSFGHLSFEHAYFTTCVYNGPSNPVCANNISISGNQYSDHIKAKESIISDQSIIFSADVIYDASDSIVLNPDFEVANEASLQIFLDGCN